MADIKNQPSDYVRFILKSEISDKLILDYEPVGWADDGIEYIRNEKYHGIMVEFTGDLSFYKEARDYLKRDYEQLGVNSNLLLQKYELTEVGGETRWSLVYEGIVDYTTRVEEDMAFKVKFNSNLLERIIETRENDKFDLERLFSIDEEAIPELRTDFIDIDGIPIAENTSLTLIKDDTINDGAIPAQEKDGDYARGLGAYQKIVFRGGIHAGTAPDFEPDIRWITTPILKLEVDGNNRISSPDTTLYTADEASQMFYVDSATAGVNDELNTSLSFSYSVDADIKTIRDSGSFSRHTLNIGLYIVRYSRNSDTLQYDIVETVPLQTILANPGEFQKISVSGEYVAINLKENEGLSLGFIGVNREYSSSSVAIKFEARVYEFNMSLTLNTSQTATENHKFLFVEDCLNRLMQILTGEDDRLVTRVFAKAENLLLGEGEFGSIGLTYGLWIRNFTDQFELYKSMNISLSDLLDSLDAVFNIGFGVEVIDNKQKLVVEQKDFFYQNEVKIKLPNQVSNVKRKTEKQDIFSSIEIGYDKGGNYSDTLGLDEPNILTNRITPIKKNKADYKKVSSIRADDIGLEIVRRKQVSLDPKEDTQQDDHIWFLDVKKSLTKSNWVQKTWEDRLRFPPQNLSYAEDFKGFLFTPLRMMFRHGWVIRAGLNQKVNLEKKISHINSGGNAELKMRFIEDNKFYSENENILISELRQPLTEPELIEFNYPISDELVRQFTAKSNINYNNNIISIPNYYFKVEFINEENQIERGYITSLKPKDNTIELIKSNEKIFI